MRFISTALFSFLFPFLFSFFAWSRFIFSAGLFLMALTFQGHAKTLEIVQKRGHLRCGVNTGLAGFAILDSKGIWQGIDADICRSIAVAVLGDSRKAKFFPLSAQQRFTALQSGEIDVLTRNTTYTLTRDTSAGLNFAPVTYYDGQAFMVKKSLKVGHTAELNGATICIQTGTTTELNAADFFKEKKMKFKPIVMESKSEIFKAFLAGRCDAYTTDASGLAADRARVADPESLLILPERISKEPMAPAVRHGDDQWLDIVTWTIYALINAEEMGITSRNVVAQSKMPYPGLQRFLGSIAGNGKALGLKEDWVLTLVKEMGNYGEIFERNVGKNSALKLERGMNNLWFKGGLLYAPPFK